MQASVLPRVGVDMSNGRGSPGMNEMNVSRVTEWVNASMNERVASRLR